MLTVMAVMAVMVVIGVGAVGVEVGVTRLGIGIIRITRPTTRTVIMGITILPSVILATIIPLITMVSLRSIS
jgi:hypothetical protein